MKKLETFWNTIHYFNYRFELKIQKFLRGDGNYSQPTSNLEVQKWRDVEKEIFEKGVKDPRYGFSSIMAGNFIFGLAVIIGGGIFFILMGLIKYLIGTDINVALFVIVCIVPFVSLTYYYVFYKDKYLIYFKEFDKKPKEWRIKWKWISFFTIIGVILFLILSFILMDYLSNIGHVPK
ncbi:hypothetical protein [Epilithonimonas hungarica]|uniref:Uncharacterized protein n=1 Tax=Epilithonimonas hungarica TaxID=454006 RepID=A0A1G7SYE0_9FLAO|nr:hypothetical protein [Epilithonimonas hungarica]SDG27439.1 hypothetical protein SAMN05421825_3106 [Epilithonimonas hungarica]